MLLRNIIATYSTIIYYTKAFLFLLALILKLSLKAKG